MSDWQPEEAAPVNQEVQVKVGEMTFLAVLKPGAAEDENGSCDQWQAAREGEHPPCWSEGACWESNVDENPSMPVEGWQRRG